MTTIAGTAAELLPAGYLAALEAFVAGESDEVVAERMGVEPVAVRAALRLATAKLLAATADVQASNVPEVSPGAIPER